jgi:hypothetical protein
MLAFGVVLAACFVVGLCVTAPARAVDVSVEFLGVLAVLAGAVIVHVWLQLLSLAGISWGVGSTAPLLIGAILILALLRRKRGARTFPRMKYGWGDAFALVAVAIVAACAWKLWIVTSDFFYHWGAKGQRFYLARGIDFEYLAQPWNGLVNPWYPNLQPELFALTALVRGRFNEPDMMWWSVLWICLALVVARELLRISRVDFFVAQTGVASLAALIAAASLASRLAGGADWMIALALLLGARGLIGELRPEDDWAVAIAAAFAASSKVEGVVLAGLLLGVYVVRRWLLSGGLGIRSALAMALPTGVVVGLWHAQNVKLHFLPGGITQRFDWHRVGAVLQAIGENVKPPALYGFPMFLLLIPFLFLNRRTRWIGAVVALQVLFYVAVYCVSPADPVIYVRTSFQRLVFHVTPALLIGACLLLSPAGRRAGVPANRSES